MPVVLLCPKLTCRSILRVPDSVRGKRVKCPSCGTAFTVPQGPRPDKPKAAPAAPKSPSK